MADVKITDLTAIDALAAADLVAVVDDVAGTPITKKATFTQLITLLGSSFQGLDADLTALAALTTTAYGRALLETANLAAIYTILNASGVLGSPWRPLWQLTGANMNVDTDQVFTKIGAFTNYHITGISAVNPSTNMTTAVGGIYPTTAKGGTPLVANTQVYTGLTGASATQPVTRNNAGCGVLSATPYLSLTTPQGGAATADFYLSGFALS